MRFPALRGAIVIALVASPCLSDTWIVTPYGDGDFATIADAIAGATEGDRIELANGTFLGDGNRNVYVNAQELTIASQSGDPFLCIIDPEGGDGLLRRAFSIQGSGADCVIENVTIAGGSALDPAYSTYGGGVLLTSGASPTFTGCVFRNNRASRGGAIFSYDGCLSTISDCLFLDNEATSYGGGISLTTGCLPLIQRCLFTGNHSDFNGGALNVWNGAAPALSQCTFHGNSAPDGGAVAWCRNFGAPSFLNSILAGSIAGTAIGCDGGEGSPVLSCCDVYGNAGGDWVDCIAGMNGLAGNMSEDPQFCDPESGDFRLEEGSGCLSENSGGCGLVGAFGEGVCTTSVEPQTWGRIKAGYRR